MNVSEQIHTLEQRLAIYGYKLIRRPEYGYALYSPEGYLVNTLNNAYLEEDVLYVMGFADALDIYADRD